MLNSVVLAGNLGSDPDIHFNSEGEPIASFNLAFRAGKNKIGWIKVTCFNRLSEICEKNLHKGAKIAASGDLSHSQWETNEGVKRSRDSMGTPMFSCVKFFYQLKIAGGSDGFAPVSRPRYCRLAESQQFR